MLPSAQCQEGSGGAESRDCGGKHGQGTKQLLLGGPPRASAESSYAEAMLQSRPQASRARQPHRTVWGALPHTVTGNSGVMGKMILRHGWRGARECTAPVGLLLLHSKQQPASPTPSSRVQQAATGLGRGVCPGGKALQTQCM